MSEIDLRDLLDGDTQVITATKCYNCPFYRWDIDWKREVCDYEVKRGGGGELRKLYLLDYDDVGHDRIFVRPAPPPSWCPLRDRAVIVVVEK